MSDVLRKTTQTAGKYNDGWKAIERDVERQGEVRDERGTEEKAWGFQKGGFIGRENRRDLRCDQKFGRERAHSNAILYGPKPNSSMVVTNVR